MNESLKLILSLSLSGSILAILIFLAKPIVKNKISKTVLYGLWVVVILRLIMPFSFESSIMNKAFYSNRTQLEINSKNPTQISATSDKNMNLVIPKANEALATDVYKSDIEIDNTKYFMDFMYQNAIYLWIIGFIITLIVNLIGYLRFLKYLKPNNLPSSNEQKELLQTLLKGRSNVELFRNSFVTTPMLIGIKRPYILIPDVHYEEAQLKNILMHELTHLRRCDIGIKWLTLIATAAHWFNPLMYFIRKEINTACELACDEAVIKNLNNAEKQAYGDTLISIVAEHKYPKAVLKATMYEEKKTLKERLLAIMNHSKKSKPIILLSIFLITAVIIGALGLGASVQTKNDKPPKIYITAEEKNTNIYFSVEGIKTKVGITGSYKWKYLGRSINVNAANLESFNYKDENILDTTTKQQIVIGTQKYNSDKKYEFSMDGISIYKAGKNIMTTNLKPSYEDGKLCLQIPQEAGEYIYSLKLNFKDKGIVNYGFVVRVDMANLSVITKYKTKYIGNNSKVGALAGLLPTPNKYFFQRYISMQTSNRPYELTVFYETKADDQYIGEWPITNTKGTLYSRLQKNALILFCMIDNLDVLTFAFRNSSSGRNSNLETSKYDTTFTFDRNVYEKKYGNLKLLGNDLKRLQAALNN